MADQHGGLESSSPLPSRCIFSYLTPLLRLGYSRPLEHPDLSRCLEPPDFAGSCASRLAASLAAAPPHLPPPSASAPRCSASPSLTWLPRGSASC